ncbi:hypothetical protein EC973_000909 [Apophysomyces ossiformis]|uniref:TELO2-interacting protein 2 n=1 Tax=Apophysomyces ossiformis TaxID=679940 RepID=A0A8H7BK89_9FUNG|nr:hypothetical protein EC973_000909 [Apophysomyces ossiformis]
MIFKSDAFITDYYERCCIHPAEIDTDANDKSRHIYRNHLRVVFEDFIQPAFTRKINPIWQKGGRYVDPWIDRDVEETPSWDVTTNGYKPVDVLAWTVEMLSKDTLNDALPKVIPPILTLLDDYEIKHKHQGVLILHILVRKLDDTFTDISGLENVFMEALFKCLNYLVTDEDLELVSSAYPCLMELISKTKKPHTKERLASFEKVLIDGVMKGLIYAAHKINCLSVLVQPIEQIYLELGSVGVRYLKTIVPALCQLLSISPSSFTENEHVIRHNALAVRTLNTVIKECWPRITYYKAMILRAIAESWLYYYGTENETELCPLLKECLQYLRAACQDQLDADFTALIEFNEKFKPLIEKLQETDIK